VPASSSPNSKGYQHDVPDLLPARETTDVSTSLLEAYGLVKVFGSGVRAVDGVDIRIETGETLGVVGESGCGKSTTAKLLLRLIDADEGQVSFNGMDLLKARGAALRHLRAHLQVVPQHPTTSLNPRMRAAASIEFNLRVQGWSKTSRKRRVQELMDLVGLARSKGERYPHELSGGELQRAAIARAVGTNPSLVICDEAVSALDKSIQAQILNLLAQLRSELGIAYLFISHDLAVVEHISDRVAVMYLGRVVESGPAYKVLAHPLHPYTQALLSADPSTGRERIVLQGEPPSAANPPSGCTFRTRCHYASEECSAERPPLLAIEQDHWVACVLHNVPHRGARTAPTAVTPST
jgi:oligopeptide/dipeptide ABC transporter ATP-binding protein